MAHSALHVTFGGVRITLCAPVDHREIRFDGPIDLLRTMQRYSHVGFDPTRRVEPGRSRVWYGLRTEVGPATILYRQTGEATIDATAWGPGAASALAAAPQHLGASDRPEQFAPGDRLMQRLIKRFPGFRVGRTRRVLGHVVPTIIAQKVTGAGARALAPTTPTRLRRGGARASRRSPPASNRRAPRNDGLFRLPPTWHRTGSAPRPLFA